MSISQNKTKNAQLFFYISLFTLVFVILESSIFIHSFKYYLSDLSYISKSFYVPPKIYLGVLYFIFAQLLLHLCFCVAVFFAVKSLSTLFHLNSQREFNLMVFIWSLGIVFILTANQHYFPNSQFARFIINLIWFPKISATIFYFCLISISLIALLTVVNLLRIAFGYPEYLVSILFAGCLVGIITVFFQHHRIPQVRGTATKPNIIIIGVDSLRPDFLSFFGSSNKTPFFDNFLNHAVVFSDAVTPLARTFPSWTTILTGKYPLETNTRSNLVSQADLKTQDSIAYLLKQQGYETIYATDETRFSNIDKNYGFDKVIGPPMGLNDFLIGTFSDFPFSNLIINTKIGEYLFPHSYANRAVFATYDPNSFINLLNDKLSQSNKNPLLLITHLCLPHFPYLWQSLDGAQFTPLDRYPETVRRVNDQAQALFSLLVKKKLTDHAIIILLSDHGEALEMNGDRITDRDLYVKLKPNAQVPKFYPPSMDNESINQSVGHGTDVLSMTQNHILLAVKLFGVKEKHLGVVPGLVSTLDIKPTILALLKLPIPASRGQSLANQILSCQYNDCDSVIKTQKRHIFIESDYSPESIRTVFPQLNKVLLEGIRLFRVDPTSTRLIVKPEMEEITIKSKQLADIYGDWVIAIYPQQDSKKKYILVNLTSGKWTDDLNSQFALKSPAKIMLNELQAFYKS